MGKRGNGEGTIYYSDQLKKWVGQYSAGRKANGKLNRISVYGNTRKEVADKLSQKITEVNVGTHIDKNSITVLQIIDNIIDQKDSSNKIRASSYVRIKQTRNKISTLPIANLEIQKVTLTDINYNLSLVVEYSNSEIDKVYGLLKQAYNYARLHDIINKDFFSIKDAVIKPKSKQKDKEIEAFTIEEQKLFLDQLDKSDDKYTDVFMIALYTGMRISEVLALSSSDIDIKNKTIKVNKTLTTDKNNKSIIGDTTKTYAGQREIPILDELLPTISKLLFKHNYWFKTEPGTFATHSTINAHFKRICRHAGIKLIYEEINGKQIITGSNVNTHMLRHTFATRCIEAGMSPVVLQKILGHKDVQTTLNTYTSVFDQYRDNEIDKVQNYLKKLGLH